MRTPPKQTPPLLYGADDVTEGYYDLERLERAFTLQALGEQRDAVGLWYRILTLYQRGVMGTWDHPVPNAGKDALTVWGLQGQLLGLGVSSAKASLDMLLAGYYSMAYAGIRHMLETFVQFLYVEVCPDEAKLWYRQPGGLKAQAKTPRCTKMIDTIKAHPDLDTTSNKVQIWDEIYDSWLLMSKGSHPTGQGITQTIGDGQGKFVIGSTYDDELSAVGFDHGLFAILLLAQALSWVRPQDEAWRTELASLWNKVSAWRTTLAAAA